MSAQSGEERKMTNDEAVDMLKRCLAEPYCYDFKYGRHCDGCNQRIAQDMAIEALKENSKKIRCKDCVKNKTEDCAMWFMYDSEGEKNPYSWNGLYDWCSWAVRKKNE